MFYVCIVYAPHFESCWRAREAVECGRIRFARSLLHYNTTGAGRPARRLSFKVFKHNSHQFSNEDCD